MKAQGKGVLILPDKAPEKTKEGIIIPLSAKAGQETGVVIDRGSECERVEIGDKVIFSSKPTSSIVVNEKDHFFGLESCIKYIF